MNHAVWAVLTKRHAERVEHGSCSQVRGPGAAERWRLKAFSTTPRVRTPAQIAM